MNPFLWVLWGLALFVVAILFAALISVMWENRAKAAQASEPENKAVVTAVVDLHRPQVMDRRHDSDVHSTITTVCGACSNVAGEPVPFPCTTIGTIRRERQRVRATGEKR